MIDSDCKISVNPLAPKSIIISFSGKNTNYHITNPLQVGQLRIGNVKNALRQSKMSKFTNT